MKLIQSISPALAAAMLVTACATHETHASAPERAEQAEADKQHARDDARQAHIDAEKARLDAQDAARAQHEADVKAQYAAQNAAQAEHDAQVGRTGVAEPQPAYAGATVAAHPGVAFVVGSYDLSNDEKAKLDAVAASLRAHPSQKVVVEGYSDETDDTKLSHHRADAVARYLEAKGVSSDRIVTRVGNWDASDEASRRRRARRRVELIVQ